MVSVCGISGCIYMHMKKMKNNPQSPFARNSRLLFIVDLELSKSWFPNILHQFVAIGWSESTDVRYKTGQQQHIARKHLDLES